MNIYDLSDVQQVYHRRTVLDLPSLRIQSGEVLAIVGPSGAGKSTLLRLLALLEEPTQGKVQISMDGKPWNYSSANIEQRRRIAMVFQRPVLLSRSVKQNMSYGLDVRGENNLPVVSMLERLRLDKLANIRADNLSGGEVQRVAFARALVLHPDILLLDEPTNNLDPENVRLIESVLTEEHEQRQTLLIIVTHNIFQAQRLANRVALLMGGQLIEVSPTQTFFNNPHDSRTKAFVSGEYVY